MFWECSPMAKPPCPNAPDSGAFPVPLEEVLLAMPVCGFDILYIQGAVRSNMETRPWRALKFDEGINPLGREHIAMLLDSQIVALGLAHLSSARYRNG